ncbi:MAG: serine/threonine-protein kinase RsbT [Planctomycetota bacterium]|jgi:serine/threonine-protein kinase RsbT
MSAELRCSIRNEMDVRRAVLESVRYSQEAGFAEGPSQMIATAVSELVRNILKYAGSGEVRLRRVQRASGGGIEILVSDHGPGIADLDAAMSDHFSTSGTLGLGLPGVKRLMDDFSMESAPGKGTRVKACKWI